MPKIKTIQQGAVDRQALLAVLNKARAAVDDKGATTIEQARHFIIKDDRVLAYNDRLAISAPVGAKTGLHLTVLAEDLFQVLSEIPEDAVSLTADDGQLVVASDTTSAGLAAEKLEGDMEELIDALKVDSLKKAAWQVLPDGFMDGIKLCAFSCSKEASNAALHSIYIRHNCMASSDNWRIGEFAYTDGQKLKDEFLLPVESALELARHAATHVQRDGSWAHFKGADGTVLSARTVDVDFLAYEKHLKVKGTQVTLPMGLGDAIKQCLVFSPGEDRYDREADVAFRKGKVIVRSQNQRGWIERTVAVPGLSVPEGFAKLRINPMFFIDILQHATTMVASEDACLFTAGTFRHMMLLPKAEQ